MTHDVTDWPRFRGVISDIDGVVYRGSAVIPSAVSAFQVWAEAGLPYAFVTNNSTKSAQEVSDKITGMGIPVCPERIVTSADVAANRLSEAVTAGGRVLVIGSDNLIRTVLSRGYTLCPKAPEAVLVGLDRQFTYEKLHQAQTAILGGVPFFGTNPDPMIPIETGFAPSAGALLSAIETATGVAPTIIGKPKPDLLQAALGILGTDPADTIMIGDQVATDIMAGRAAGIPTVLVRTGVKAGNTDAADHVVDALTEIPVEACRPD